MKDPGRSSISGPRVRVFQTIVFALVAFCAVALRAQSDDYDARRQKAFTFFEANNFTEALPLLQKLHDENPKDVVVLERLSFSTYASNANISDPAQRKLQRAKARKLAVEAHALGDNSDLLKVILDIPEDGGDDPVFSGTAEVQKAMQDAEAAFTRGDFDAALQGYARALELNPKQYEAALYTGDVWYKRKDNDQAGKWYLRAVEIDPNRETAYRYWGNSLYAEGRTSEAKEKFIGAIVAEPYNRRAWTGLSQWAKASKMILSNPQINPPGKVEDKGKDAQGKEHTLITIDPSTMGDNGKADGTNAWFMYTLSKAVWHGDRFKKEFPNEKEYRHSLPEEVDGFSSVVTKIKEDESKKKIKTLDPALAALVKISDEGLLEAFVLISKADQSITRDYAAYRDAHREKIRQYISEWLLQPE